MKLLKGLALGVFFALLLTACGPQESKADETVVKIGVSPAPHGEIVEQVVEDLAKEGIKLEIVEYTDYIMPNKALDQGDIDLNFFQHVPYLENMIKSDNLSLEVLGKVHIEPMGVFSDKVKSVAEIPENGEVYIPNDTTNGGRALLLLQREGLIKLGDGAGTDASEQDIVENPKRIKFTPLEAALITGVYKDVDAAVINGNYAIEAGLNPVKDSVAIEDADSPYVNIIACREGEANKEEYQKILKAIQSDKVKKFIEEKYDGAVVPAY